MLVVMRDFCNLISYQRTNYQDYNSCLINVIETPSFPFILILTIITSFQNEEI